MTGTSHVELRRGRVRRLGDPAPGQPDRAGRRRRRGRPGGDGDRAQRRGAHRDGLRRCPAEATPNDMVVAVRLDADGDSWTPRWPASTRRWPTPAAATAGRARRRRRGPRAARCALCHSRARTRSRWSRCPGRRRSSRRWTPLEAGRDVMVFSDNVPVEQELALKRSAAEPALLVMGPDCGTAVVGGLGLGFANVVSARPGRHRRRVRHRLPAGARAARPRRRRGHLRARRRRPRPVRRGPRARHPRGAAAARRGPGGRADRAGLQAARARGRRRRDPGVRRGLATPVELALLGRRAPRPHRGDRGGAAPARAARCRPGRSAGSAAAPSGGRLLRGLFVGGTLASEAKIVATGLLGADAGHTFVDFGDDAYTAGRAHPMIDPTLRLEHLARAAADPDTAVILLDVVLGHGAEPDPAALLAPAVAGDRQARRGRGRRHRRRPAGPRPPGAGARRRRRRGPPVQRAGHPPRRRAAGSLA